MATPLAAMNPVMGISSRAGSYIVNVTSHDKDLTSDFTGVANSLDMDDNLYGKDEMGRFYAKHKYDIMKKDDIVEAWEIKTDNATVLMEQIIKEAHMKEELRPVHKESIYEFFTGKRLLDESQYDMDPLLEKVELKKMSAALNGNLTSSRNGFLQAKEKDAQAGSYTPDNDNLQYSTGVLLASQDMKLLREIKDTKIPVEGVTEEVETPESIYKSLQNQASALNLDMLFLEEKYNGMEFAYINESVIDFIKHPINTMNSYTLKKNIENYNTIVPSGNTLYSVRLGTKSLAADNQIEGNSRPYPSKSLVFATVRDAVLDWALDYKPNANINKNTRFNCDAIIYFDKSWFNEYDKRGITLSIFPVNFQVNKGRIYHASFANQASWPRAYGFVPLSEFLDKAKIKYEVVSKGSVKEETLSESQTFIPYECETKYSHHWMDKGQAKPIKGKGVPMLIMHKNNKNWRMRSELLLFKDNKLFLAKEDKVNSYGLKYKLPGGGIDGTNESIESSAARECEEEAKITPKNLKYTGIEIEYKYPNPPSWHLLILNPDGIYYDGAISFVCIAEYDKPYEGSVKKMDQDPAVSKGRFYSYDEVKDILSEKHKKLFKDHIDSGYQQALAIYNQLSPEEQAFISPNHPGRFVDAPNAIAYYIHKTKDGKPIGFAVLTKLNGNSNNVACVGSIGILKEFRRKGYAKLLIQKAKDAAREAGYKKIIYKADKDNIASIKSAESAGFKANTGFKSIDKNRSTVTLEYQL